MDTNRLFHAASRRGFFGLFLALMFGYAPCALSAAPEPYTPLSTTCDGLPRADIETAAGYCLGIVFAPSVGRYRHRLVRTPRVLLQLPDRKRWLLSDLGGWTSGLGKVWRLKVDESGAIQRRVIAAGLSLPHTLAYGPDGAIYLAEMHRISRLDPDSGAITAVIEGLPANKLHIGRHPLSHFLFDRNGDLLVNIGADSDQCERARPDAEPTCREAEGPEQRAVLRRYPYLGNGVWNLRYSIEAKGLRNSLVLLLHPSGTLLQAENSYDFAPSEPIPHDELNVIRQGANYGWPYCYDRDSETPAWRNQSPLACNAAEHAQPAILLPPHSAPLGGLYYNADLLPGLRDKMLISLHGYYPTGSRILAYTVDAQGVPFGGEPLDLTPGWTHSVGRRPAGAPVALALASDGSIWITDDRNASVLRLSLDRP